MRKQTVIKICVGLLLVFGLTYAFATRDSSESNGESITAVGSTALQPLVEAASEEYISDHPGVFINVQGGGSGTGLSQIESGAVQMGNSDLFAEEKSGIDPKGLVDHRVAVVGVAPIVNKDTGVSNLTTEQLIKVFTGKVTNWRQVGGKNIPVTLINRSQGSGTRVTFEQYGLNGKESAVAQEQDSSGTVRQIVGTTPGAVSYVAFGYLNDSVKPLKLNGIAPTATNVKNNQWKIWSYEHIYTNGQPKGLTKTFLSFLKGKHIQEQLFQKLGYISVGDMEYQRSWNGKITKGSGE